VASRARGVPRIRDVEAVVFDLDGVLVDSEPIHFRAANRVLARYERSIAEHEYRTFIGLGEGATWTVWKERFELRPSVEDLLKAHTAARITEIRAGVEPIEEAARLARRLRADGVRLALASSSARAIIDALLAALDLEREFAIRVSGEDAEVRRGKPAPDVYLRAADLAGAPADGCIAIEDSAPGVAAAKAAGMFCVAVPNRWTEDQDFRDADVVLVSLRYFELLVL
jgi:HAD superfamily hydrolase (TIGR01509 family)